MLNAKSADGVSSTHALCWDGLIHSASPAASAWWATHRAAPRTAAEVGRGAVLPRAAETRGGGEGGTEGSLAAWDTTHSHAAHPAAACFALQSTQEEQHAENSLWDGGSQEWRAEPPGAATARVCSAEPSPARCHPALCQGHATFQAPLPSFELARPRNLLLSGTADERRDKFRKKSLYGSEEKHRSLRNPSGATAQLLRAGRDRERGRGGSECCMDGVSQSSHPTNPC